MLGEMRHKAAIALGCVLLAVALAACGGTPEPTPGIEATVQARLNEERAAEATTEARDELAKADATIPAPAPTRKPDLPTATARPSPTSTPVPSTRTPTPTPVPTPDIGATVEARVETRVAEERAKAAGATVQAVLTADNVLFVKGGVKVYQRGGAKLYH